MSTPEVTNVPMSHLRFDDLQAGDTITGSTPGGQFIVRRAA